MKIGKVLYRLTGILLLTASLLTRESGLSREDQQVYEGACELQEKMAEYGFEDFLIEDYKVRIYDGTSDYVIDGGMVTREEPVFQTFVGTAYEVDGEYQIIVPAMDVFRDMMGLLGTAQGVMEGSDNLDSGSYGLSEHVATLWHEAFHAYQFSVYTDAVTSLKKEGGEAEVKTDSPEQAAELFSAGMDILREAYFTQDPSLKREYLLAYLENSWERKALLSSSEEAAERYYETIEGTARYIESGAYELQNGTGAMEDRYLKEFTYAEGTDKYYQLGMIKCRILNQLDAEAMSCYDFSMGLDQYFQTLVMK